MKLESLLLIARGPFAADVDTVNIEDAMRERWRERERGN